MSQLDESTVGRFLGKKNMRRILLFLLGVVSGHGLIGHVEITYAATSGKIGMYYGEMGVNNGIGLFGAGGYFVRGDHDPHKST